MHLKELGNDHNSSLLLKPSPNSKLLLNQFKYGTPGNNNDPEKISSSKYYDIDEIHNIKIPSKNKSLSLIPISYKCMLSWWPSRSVEFHLKRFWHNNSNWNRITYR